jgi:hypothetical protein
MKKFLLRKQFYVEGLPLVGYPVEVMTSGNTPAVLYPTENSDNKMEGNVLTTDSLGRAEAYVPLGASYQMVVKDKQGQVLRTTDVFSPEVNGDKVGKRRASPLALVYNDTVDSPFIDLPIVPTELTLILRAISGTAWFLNPPTPGVEGAVLRVVAQGGSLTGPEGSVYNINLGFYLGAGFKYYEGRWNEIYSRVSTDPNYVFDPGPI